MNFSDPKVTIDLKEYDLLLKKSNELKDLVGKNPLTDEQLYQSFILMAQAQRGSINATLLDIKLKEIGVRIVNVHEKNYSFVLRPL